MFQRMLVATDLSEESLIALDIAGELARTEGKDVTVGLMSVLENPRRALTGFDLGAQPISSDEILQMAESEVRKRLESLGVTHLYGLSTIAHVVRESSFVAEEIINIAKSLHYQIIVVATHGRTGLKRKVMGSVAEAVVHLSPVPVLVVPCHPRVRKDESEREHVFQIAVATDLSEGSEALYPYVNAFIRAYNFGRVQTTVVHVLGDVLSATFNLTLGVNRDALWSDLSDDTEEQIQSQIAQNLSGTLTNVAVIRQMRSVAEDIIIDAERRNAHVLIIGAYHRDVASRFILGSATERVVRHAPCPVLVVPLGEG